MSWQDRAGDRKRAILIDPETKSWVISGGKLQFDSTSMSQVYHAVMTQIGSIPTSPKYGSRIHESWPITTSMPRDLEKSIVASLDLLVANGVVKKGSISVEVEPYAGTIGIITVDWIDGGGSKRHLSVPMQPGIRD